MAGRRSPPAIDIRTRSIGVRARWLDIRTRFTDSDELPDMQVTPGP